MPIVGATTSGSWTWTWTRAGHGLRARGPGPVRLDMDRPRRPTMTALARDHLLYERCTASTLTAPTYASLALRFGPSDAATSPPSSAPSAAYALDRLGAQSERRPKPLLETDWHILASALRAPARMRQLLSRGLGGLPAVDR